MFIKRLAAALVGVPILVALFVWGSPLLLFVVLAAAMLLAQSEYAAMVFSEDSFSRRVVVALGVFLFAAWGLGIVYSLPAFVFHLSLFVGVALLFFAFMLRPGDMKTVGSRLAGGSLGLLYVPLMAVYLVAIHNLDATQGGLYLMVLFAIVWLNDTGGYFAGKSLGKHKLYALVSPNKTWEGAVGGLLAGIGGAFLFNWILGFGWCPWHVLVLAVSAGAIGQAGDLCESLLKRSYGIKDSGSIIPGHGGILDRIDAILFAAPAFYYYLSLAILG